MPGSEDSGPPSAGQAAGLTHEILPARVIIGKRVREASAILCEIPELLPGPEEGGEKMGHPAKGETFLA